MIFSVFCLAFEQNIAKGIKPSKPSLTSFNSISICSVDCDFVDVDGNGLEIFSFRDPALSKENYDLVTAILKQEFKKRKDRNGFSFQLSGANKDEILKNANITQKRNLYFQFVSPVLKTMVFNNSEVKSVKVGVNIGDDDDVYLDTIGIRPIDSSLKPEEYRSREHGRGIAHIGESDPGFKNFEKVILNSGKPLFTEQELLSVLKKNDVSFETKKVSEINTTRFSKGEVDIIKVKLKIESENSKLIKRTRDVEAYFLSTKAGLFDLVPFEEAFKQYYNPIEQLYYGESNSHQFFLLGIYNSFKPSRIIKITKNGLPEAIDAKMGYMD